MPPFITVQVSCGGLGIAGQNHGPQIIAEPPPTKIGGKASTTCARNCSL